MPLNHTGFVADSQVLLHDGGSGQPEQPERFRAIVRRLRDSGVLAQLKEIGTKPATEEELHLVHTPAYVALVDREAAEGATILSTGDAPICPESPQAARAAAGSVLRGVDAVFSGAVSNAFCAVRPPGHHASQERGMGFCLFNNVALAARYAQKQWGAKRVLIADWDVHHGNGTQDVFYEDNSVLFFSTHQSPWYPGTGATSDQGSGAGLHLTINCPFGAGAGRSEILGAFESVLLPAAERFQPDLIVLSAGFDSRAGDPLGQFTLSDRDFEDMTTRMLALADRTCEGRLVSVLEGGYSIEGLAAGTEAHVRTLAGI